MQGFCFDWKCSEEVCNKLRLCKPLRFEITFSEYPDKATILMMTNALYFSTRHNLLLIFPEDKHFP